MTTPSPAQLALDFEHRPSLTGEDFLVAPGNADAVAWLDRWPDWPAAGLVIHGPAGCGKTHLARVFMARSGAARMTDEVLRADEPAALFAGSGAWVVDDADAVAQAVPEATFLHFFNAVAEAGGHLLMTAAGPPGRWGIGLADLRSRLNALPTARIGGPDDALIEAVLIKLFADRQLRVEGDVLAYVLARMERSFAGARQVVAAVDAAALAERRNITVPLVRQVLDGAGTASDRGGTPWT
jgi:chromosomal replication initiation ATPase DnaA